MAKYRVELENKKVKSVAPATGDVATGDTILEENTGDTIWAIIDADSDEEAKEKADKVAEELQTRQQRNR